MEHQADDSAVDLMINAGFDPNGLAALFDELSLIVEPMGMLGTHPDPEIVLRASGLKLKNEGFLWKSLSSVMCYSFLRLNRRMKGHRKIPKCLRVVVHWRIHGLYSFDCLFGAVSIGACCGYGCTPCGYGERRWIAVGRNYNAGTGGVALNTSIVGGCWHLDARCDATLSLTLPNHTTMVTGRPVSGTNGHQWRTNSTPPSTSTYHNHLGRYVPSAFDVAHDRGVFTAVLAGKEKFVLMDRSWSATFGAIDKTGTDNGRDKIDQFVMDADPAVLTEAMLAVWRNARPKSLVLLHYRQPDGRAWVRMGFDTGLEIYGIHSACRQRVRKLFRFLDAHPKLRASVAILLASDHGGGVPFRSHVDPSAAIVHTIPFLAWVGGHGGGLDLYAMNRGKRTAHSGNGERHRLPNIRNGELGNTALHLFRASRDSSIRMECRTKTLPYVASSPQLRECNHLELYCDGGGKSGDGQCCSCGLDGCKDFLVDLVVSFEVSVHIDKERSNINNLFKA